MKKNRKNIVVLIVCLIACLVLVIQPQITFAGTVDSELNYVDLNVWNLKDPKSFPAGNGTWNVESGGRTVKQIINGEPTFFTSTEDVINEVITGTIKVDNTYYNPMTRQWVTLTDDDFIGFVLGFQDPIVSGPGYDCDLIIYDWKRATQSNTMTIDGISMLKYTYEGHSLRSFNGQLTTVPYSGGLGAYSKYFWYREAEVGKSIVLGTDYDLNGSSVKGWEFNKEYLFKILYTESQIKIQIDDEVIFDVNASDFPEIDAFKAGKIGFYNNSQELVTYGNIKSAPGVSSSASPIAKNDKYGLQTGQTLTVDKYYGIFSNDYDPNLDNFTAVIDDEVSNGILTLNTASGAFGYQHTSGIPGPDSFTYHLIDEEGRVSETVTVDIYAIDGVNVGPTNITISDADVFITDPNGSVVGTLATVDSNAGDFHDYMLTNNASGIFGILDNKIILSDSSKLTHGSYTIRVKSTDFQGLSIEKDLVISVVNRNPEVVQGESLSVSMSEDADPISFELNLDASDADGDEISWNISGQAAHGTASVNESGDSCAIAYVPTSNFNGVDEFIVEISDGFGGNDSIVVAVTIEAVNDAPINTQLPAVSGTMHNGNTLTAGVGSWSDPDSDNNLNLVTYTYQWQRAADLAGNGLMDIVGQTTAAYQINKTDNDQYIRVKVTASDSQNPLPARKEAYSEYRQVVNAAPVIVQADPVEVTMDEDSSPNAFNLLLEASDPDGDAIEWLLKTPAQFGTATVSGTTSTSVITYTPELNYYGSDTFTACVSDDNGGSDEITVSIDIRPVNDRPTVHNSIKNGNEDTLMQFSLDDFADHYSDVENSPLYKIELQSLPENGMLKINGTPAKLNDVYLSEGLNNITFIPDANWNGSTTFNWFGHDRTIFSVEPATMTLQIAPVNDPLVNTVLPSISGVPHRGKTLTANVGSWNDEIDNNSTESITYTYQWQRADAADAHGLEDISDETDITYTLTGDDNGKYIRVSVTGTDPGTPGTESLTLNTSWMLITNETPLIAEGDVIEINMSEEGTPDPFKLDLNASDADGDAISWRISSQAEHGIASVTGTGELKEVSYEPVSDYNGADLFVVQIEDPDGSFDTISVNVVIEPVNDAPVNTDLPTISGVMHNGNTLTAEPGTWNDDKDNQSTPSGEITYTYQWETAVDGSGSELSEVTEATERVYTLSPDENDKFIRVKVTAIDSGLPGSKNAVANSDWNQVKNAAPVISQGNTYEIVMDEDAANYKFELSAEDPDHDSISWEIYAAPSKATAVLSSSTSDLNQEVVYTPDPDFNGTDSFIIKAFDANKGEMIVTIGVKVNSINDLPVVSTPEVLYAYENSKIKTLQITFTDIDTEDTHSGSIDWGDGSGYESLGSVNSPISLIEHPYASEGTYTAKVNITDSNGGETISLFNVVIRERSRDPIVKLIINGDIIEQTTNVSTQIVGDQTTTTVYFNPEKLTEILEGYSQGSHIIVPVEDLLSDEINGVMNGQLVKTMEDKKMVIELQTAKAIYQLPSSEIKIDEISRNFGSHVALEEIEISIRISDPVEQDIELFKKYSTKNDAELILPPVSFEIVARYGDKIININNFNGYVDRLIPLKDVNDRQKITTAVTLNAEGNAMHIPTQIIVKNGNYYAKISSMTNSSYALLWNPIEFKDVEKHWAKEAVNDMGSRMIISGIGSGAFEPDREITRAEFVTIVIKALGIKPGEGSHSFKDVSNSDWSAGYIKTAYDLKLISGYSNDQFGPEEKITREQAMVIIAKAMEITALNVDTSTEETMRLLSGFTDGEDIADYAKRGTVLCIKAGIVSGRSDHLMAAKDNISRAEIAAMVRKLLQKSNLI